MTSAAQYLHDFFEAEGEVQNGTSFRLLIEAAHELEDELDALLLVGGKVKGYLDLLPRIRARLNQNVSDDLSKIFIPQQPNGKRHRIRLESADMSLLDLAIERTQVAGQMTPERNDSIRTLLAVVKAQISKDESLDPQLRLFVARALLGVESALDEYDATGEFKLREALVTLFGLLRAAEAASSEPKPWRDAWEKYGVPATAGLIASLPQVAIGGATLLKALGGAS